MYVILFIKELGLYCSFFDEMFAAFSTILNQQKKQRFCGTPIDKKIGLCSHLWET
jgi:hypothetical protein